MKKDLDVTEDSEAAKSLQKRMELFEDNFQTEKNRLKFSKYNLEDFKSRYYFCVFSLTKYSLYYKCFFLGLLGDEERWMKKAKTSMSRSLSKIHIDAEDIAEDINVGVRL